jgi:hypothetical protein
MYCCLKKEVMRMKRGPGSGRFSGSNRQALTPGHKAVVRVVHPDAKGGSLAGGLIIIQQELNIIPIIGIPDKFPFLGIPKVNIPGGKSNLPGLRNERFRGEIN